MEAWEGLAQWTAVSAPCHSCGGPIGMHVGSPTAPEGLGAGQKQITGVSHSAALLNLTVH